MPWVAETSISRGLSEISCIYSSHSGSGHGLPWLLLPRLLGFWKWPLKCGALPCCTQEAAPSSLWPPPCPSSPQLLSLQKPIEGLSLKFPYLPNDRICQKEVQLPSIFLLKCHSPRRLDLYPRGRDWKSNITPRTLFQDIICSPGSSISLKTTYHPLKFPIAPLLFSLLQKGHLSFNRFSLLWILYFVWHECMHVNKFVCFFFC